MNKEVCYNPLPQYGLTKLIGKQDSKQMDVLFVFTTVIHEQQGEGKEIL